jgi:hypothetical protein
MAECLKICMTDKFTKKNRRRHTNNKFSKKFNNRPSKSNILLSCKIYKNA